MGKRELIKSLKVEIGYFKSEIKKREDIIQKLMELGGISDIKKGKGTRKKRGPGRPPGAIVKKRGRKPGRPATGKTKKKVVRKQYAIPVGDMILGVLKMMKQPASVESLTEKVHKKHPEIGGVKYRAIVSSMISRDKKFQRVGKGKVTYRKRKR